MDGSTHLGRRMGPRAIRATGVTLLALLASAWTAAQEPVSRPTTHEAPASRPAAAGDEAQEETPVEVAALEAAEAWSLSGYLSISYRARKRSSKNDEDLYGFLSLDGGSPDRDDVTLHVFGRATLDLDGDAGDRDDIFKSLNDIGGDQLDLKLYEAFVDLRRSLAPTSLGVRKIRVGRQNVHAGYTYLVDGARVDFQPIEELGRLHIGVFGGVPEFLYEASRTGDWLVGTTLRAEPLEGTRIDLRYLHVEDRNGFAGTRKTFQDDYADLTLRQLVGENAHLQAAWTTIDLATRDVSLMFHWDLPDEDLSLHARYMWQNDITREFTAEFDPYRAVLGPSFSHHQFEAQVSKLWGDVGLDVGLSGRVLHDGDREAAFNREYFRAFATLSADDWPSEGFDVSLTGEYWGADRDEAATFGAEVVWRPEKGLRISAGTYYSLYKYDLFVVEEREDATTLYLRARWDFTKDFQADVRYEFETGDEGDFHSFLVGLTWSF